MKILEGIPPEVLMEVALKQIAAKERTWLDYFNDLVDGSRGGADKMHPEELVKLLASAARENGYILNDVSFYSADPETGGKPAKYAFDAGLVFSHGMDGKRYTAGGF